MDFSLSQGSETPQMCHSVILTDQPNATRQANFTPKSLTQHSVLSILDKCDKENSVSQNFTY